MLFFMFFLLYFRIFFLVYLVDNFINEFILGVKGWFCFILFVLGDMFFLIGEFGKSSVFIYCFLVLVFSLGFVLELFLL